MPPRPADLPAALAEGRARGAAAVDPVGWHAVEALARRAAAHQGAARAHIERRVGERLAGLLARCEAAAAAAPAGMPPDSPLAALRALAVPAPRAAATPAPAAGAALPELTALRDFRQRWQRLQAEHWLDQSIAGAPDNAGPLNSHALAVRTLRQLDALSPGYVVHLLSQLDALRWLEPEAGGKPARPAPGSGIGPSGNARHR